MKYTHHTCGDHMRTEWLAVTRYPKQSLHDYSHRPWSLQACANKPKKQV